MKTKLHAGRLRLSASLVITDLAAAGIGGALYLWIHGWGESGFLVPVLIAVPIAFACVRLYPGRGLGPVRQLQLMARCTALLSLLAAAVSAIFKAGSVVSLVDVVLLWFLMLVPVALIRGLVRGWLPGQGPPAPTDLMAGAPLQDRQARLNRVLKRTLDVAVAGPLLLLSVPIILLAVLAVKSFSKGAGFYWQEREGLQGRLIRIVKIRTMVPNAEAVLAEYLAHDPEARCEWDQFMKLQHDPRVVPRVGRLLRRLSIDELPQLWNIVKGDLSMVGPRPFPEYHLTKFAPAFRKLRSQVMPGLTGLWQVSARSDGDLAIQQQLDTYYIQHWSIWLDIYLLARTVGAVLFSKGAY